MIMVQKVNGNGLKVNINQKVNKIAQGQILWKGPKILQLEDIYTKPIICQAILTIKSKTRSQKSIKIMKSQPYASKVKLGQERS